MSGSLGNVVSARELLDAWGAELLRYMLLSTHYRRPIEFTEEVLANSKKGLAVFSRLFERIGRLTGKPPVDGSQDMDQIAGRLGVGGWEFRSAGGRGQDAVLGNDG